MEMSARVEYALIALLRMASRPNRKVPLKLSEITLEQAIPDRYLEQILMNLRYGGIVQTQRGAKGGYTLARDPQQITLLEIIASVEGQSGQDQARKHRSREAIASSGEQGSRDKTLVDEIWQQASAASQTVLRNYTLQDLCQRVEDARQTDPMYHI